MIWSEVDYAFCEQNIPKVNSTQYTEVLNVSAISKLMMS